MYLRLYLPTTIYECKNDPIDLTLQNSLGNEEDNDKIELRIYVPFRSDNTNKLERCNEFLRNLVGMKAFQEMAPRINYLHFDGLYLDDLEPLLTTLQQSGANIEKLQLDCYLTEQAAMLVGDILKHSIPPSIDDENNQIAEAGTPEGGNFCIKELYMNETSGSTAWIDGFLQNKTITCLYLNEIPIMYTAIHFIINSPQLKEVAITALELENEEERTARERLDVSINNHWDDTTVDMDLKTIDFIFIGHEELTLSVCRGIGCILRRANNLEDLVVRALTEIPPYDFLKDAIHCNSLELGESSDFDPRTLFSLVNGVDGADGKLKHIYLTPKYISKVDLLFQILDSSLLDTLFIYCHYLMDSHSYDRFIETLCHQIAENKGPKNLNITLHSSDREGFVTGLASSLAGNDKIERLDISAHRLGSQEQQLLGAMSKMPNLKSWKIHFSRVLSQEEAEKWNEWIVHQLQTNWTIQDISCPFILGNDVKDMLIFNKHWRKFFSCHDKLSSGIWSPALSQIERIDLMFYVLREVPNLFQQVADSASEQDIYRLPCFMVPNCPACGKRRKLQNA